jgi:hypothetical protein
MYMWFRINPTRRTLQSGFTELLRPCRRGSRPEYKSLSSPRLCGPNVELESKGDSYYSPPALISKTGSYPPGKDQLGFLLGGQEQSANGLRSVFHRQAPWCKQLRVISALSRSLMNCVVTFVVWRVALSSNPSTETTETTETIGPNYVG